MGFFSIIDMLFQMVTAVWMMAYYFTVRKVGYKGK